MTKYSDVKLEEIAFKVDDIIVGLINEYKIDPLSLTSIIAARLVLANDFMGSGDDFRKLLANIPEMKLENVDTTDQIVH
jgi:hypothetical protein